MWKMKVAIMLLVDFYDEKWLEVAGKKCTPANVLKCVEEDLGIGLEECDCLGKLLDSTILEIKGE